MNNETFSFISQLSAVPAEGLARIPILVTGSWVKGGRNVSFTRTELCTAIDNFQKLSNHDLNVDYDHASEDLERAAGAPTPSAGRILALDDPEEFKGSGVSGLGTGENPNAQPPAPCPQRWILFGRYEPTARARQMIKNREYRYVSAAFAKDYPDRKNGEPQGLTLTSVALTNQPFLDELPEIWLSVLGVRDQGLGVSEPKSLVPNPQPLDSTRLRAEQGGRMTKLTLRCSADGKHEAYDGDSKIGDLGHDHLCQYAAAHLAGAAGSEREELSAQLAASFARDIGAEGRNTEEIRGLVALALHPLKAETTLLSESIGADGRLNNSRLDALDDSGKISRSAWRRAKDAEQRVHTAFTRGQITPAMMATGAPLRLALSDGGAFKALIEDRPALLKTDSVVGLGGSGAETGETPQVMFSRMVEEKKQQLMQTDVHLGELEALRKANALVTKHNPELLKSYRADAKSA